jgi:hypothetical protein
MFDEPTSFHPTFFSWVGQAAKKKKIKIGRQVDLTTPESGRPDVLPVQPRQKNKK